jgi:hypothetical protein
MAQQQPAYEMTGLQQPGQGPTAVNGNGASAPVDGVAGFQQEV